MDDQELARARTVPTSPIIWAWPHPSSRGVTVYQTCLHEEGRLSCNCPGWTQLKPGKPRGCKHTKDTSASEIQDRLKKNSAGVPMVDRIVIPTSTPNIKRRLTVPSLKTDGERLYTEDDE